MHSYTHAGTHAHTDTHAHTRTHKIRVLYESYESDG